jgi:hypothetical protein
MITVECPYCGEENETYVELWQAIPKASPRKITCTKCEEPFGARFNISLNYEVWRLD